MLSKSCPHPADCDFEDPDNEYCSWVNIESSMENVQWKLHSSSEFGEFGFIPDNTFESADGHFILTTGIQKGTFSRLISEKMDAVDEDQTVCLSFYYFFPSIGEYNLTVKLVEYNTSEVILWSLNDQGADQASYEYNKWNLGQVSFETSDMYRIYLEGYVGGDTRYFVGKIEIF